MNAVAVHPIAQANCVDRVVKEVRVSFFAARKIFLAATLVISGPVSSSEVKRGDPAGDIDRGATELSRYERSQVSVDTSRRAENIKRKYEELFPVRSVEFYERLGKKEQATLFFSASKVAIYTMSESDARSALELYRVLGANHSLTPTVTERMYKILVNAHLFAEAQIVAGEAGAFLPYHPLDVRIDASAEGVKTPRILSLQKSKPHRLQGVDLAGLRLVVVGSYACSASRRAAEELMKDPYIGALFESEALWISPPGELYDWENIVKFNEGQPRHFRFGVAYGYQGWPFDVWNTPTFYVLKNGQVKQLLRGWGEGQLQNLQAALSSE